MSKKNINRLHPGLSVDCAIFGFDSNQLKILLIERSSELIGKKSLALPGDLIFHKEDIDSAATRVLNELTGLNDIYLEQVGAFGNPDRLNKEEDQAWLRTIRDKPDERVVTIAYYSLVNMNEYSPEPSSFAKSAAWFPVKEVKELAFDHSEILQVSLERLKLKLKNQPIGFNLLPEKFTFSELQKLYEAFLGRELDKRNFRRKMVKLKIVEKLEEKQQGVPHKRSQYFQFNKKNYDALVKDGFDNFGF